MNKQINIIKKSLKSKKNDRLLFNAKRLEYFAKDNFWTENFPTTASSNFLDDFCPGEDSSVIKFLNQQKSNLLGKTVLDEFACGGTGLFANSGLIFNPYNDSHIVGGSSSGSALVVAKNLVPFSLGSDTGDSVRRPATYCGVIGFKPSYGLLSRFGVIPMASSLDTIGIIGQKIKDVKTSFNILRKKDSHDLLTATSKKKLLSFANIKKKIVMVNNLEKNASTEITNLYRDFVKKLEILGYETDEIIVPKKIRDNLQTSYLILCSSELVSHLNSLQGVTYGNKEKISIINKRSRNLGKEVKQRLLIGSYFLDKVELLEKAQKLRCLVKDWETKLFRNYDFLIFLSSNDVAPLVANFDYPFAGLSSSNWKDNLFLLANFTGSPSLSLPIGFVNGLPIAVSINSCYGSDNKILNLVEKLENVSVA